MDRIDMQVLPEEARAILTGKINYQSPSFHYRAYGIPAKGFPTGACHLLCQCRERFFGFLFAVADAYKKWYDIGEEELFEMIGKKNAIVVKKKIF